MLTLTKPVITILPPMLCRLGRYRRYSGDGHMVLDCLQDSHTLAVVRVDAGERHYPRGVGWRLACLSTVPGSYALYNIGFIVLSLFIVYWFYCFIIITS